MMVRDPSSGSARRDHEMKCAQYWRHCVQTSHWIAKTVFAQLSTTQQLSLWTLVRVQPYRQTEINMLNEAITLVKPQHVHVGQIQSIFCFSHQNQSFQKTTKPITNSQSKHVGRSIRRGAQEHTWSSMGTNDRRRKDSAHNFHDCFRLSRSSSAKQ